MFSAQILSINQSSKLQQNSYGSPQLLKQVTNLTIALISFQQGFCLLLQRIQMTNQNTYDYLFKYIIVGDSNVGKSCLLSRFIDGRFKNDLEPTLGVEFASKIIETQGTNIKIQIWDTAGQQSFKAITRSYYKGSIAAFLVFDITNRQSFENLHKWLYEVKNYSHERIEITLLGNKSDKRANRKVTFDEADGFANGNGLNYLEVSALNGERVEEGFLRMSQKILQHIKDGNINPDGDLSIGVRRGKKHLVSQHSKQLTLPPPTRKGTCCL